MNAESNYYQFRETEESLILSDRVELNWKQILLYPIPLGIFMFVLTGKNIIIALGFALIFGLFYMVFRYSAWFYFKEFQISKSDGSVQLTNKLCRKVVSSEQIDISFSKRSVQFEEHERSGKTRYILQYVTHKAFSILVVKSEEDKLEIEHRLKRVTVSLS